MILYFPYHPETHFIKIDTVFSAISYRQSQFTNPTSPQVFIISLWVPPDSTCMDWSKVVKWCSNSVFVGRCWMASRWIPSHPIPRSSNVTHPAWAKFWVCVRCSESFTLASSFCKPWSTLFLQGGFGREFVRKGNPIRLEVGFFKLMGDRILFIVKKTVSNLQLVGKHQCFCGHHSLFFRHCHSSTVVSSIQCNFFCAVWPLTKNTSIMMHYAHTHSSTPSTTKEHPHSLGFTVSSKHWIPKVCSNVVDLAPALVQQQSVRGILGACGWLFVAQWHFLSSREAWFSMTRIASQEHRGHTVKKRHTAHIITCSNHATWHPTSLKHHRKHHLITFLMFHIKLYKVYCFRIFHSFMSVVTNRPETQQMPLGGLQNLCHHFLEVILTMDLTGHLAKWSHL